MMDLYYLLLPFTTSLLWFLAIAFLVIIWGVWAHEEIANGEVRTSSNNLITLGDMLYITIMTSIVGGIGGVLAGIVWPITLPILLVIGGVYGTKLVKEYKQERNKAKLKKEQHDKLQAGIDELRNK